MKAVRAEEIAEVAVTPDRACVRLQCVQGQTPFLFEFPMKHAERVAKGLTDLVLGLASQEGRFTTRQAINVDGGPAGDTMYLAFEIATGASESLSLDRKTATTLRALLDRYLQEIPN